MGRPSKFNEERTALILEALKTGHYLATAARYAGISRDTLNEWRKQFPEFSDAVDRARAEAVVRNVGVIQQAAHRGDWRAAAWWLERSCPEHFGRRGIEHASKVEPVPISIVYSPEEKPDDDASVEESRLHAANESQ